MNDPIAVTIHYKDGDRSMSLSEVERTIDFPSRQVPCPDDPPCKWLHLESYGPGRVVISGWLHKEN